MTGAQRKSDLFVLLALLACSLSLNIFQRHEIEILRLHSEGSPIVGTTIPDLSVVDMGGNRSVLSFKNQRVATVLYVFTPPCHWCARNWDNIRTITHLNRGAFRFVGLSLQKNGLREYVAKNEIPFPVFTDIPDATKRLLRIGATPETFVISADGRVLKLWVGAFTGDNESQVASYFHAELPGLSPERVPSAGENAK